VASAQSRRKSVERVLACAYAFCDKHPEYLGASLSWCKSALIALGKSSAILRAARGGDKESQKTISEVFQKKDAEGMRSARLLQESATLLDHGRATVRVKVQGDSVGHDIMTRTELRMLPERTNFAVGDLFELRHRIPTMTNGDFDDDHELAVHDPFTATSYRSSVGAFALGNAR
jgi:hypothetical protein